MYLKNELSKICGRQPIKNFTWSILEYLGINISSNMADFFSRNEL